MFDIQAVKQYVSATPWYVLAIQSVGAIVFLLGIPMAVGVLGADHYLLGIGVYLAMAVLLASLTVSWGIASIAFDPQQT